MIVAIRAEHIAAEGFPFQLITDGNSDAQKAGHGEVTLYDLGLAFFAILGDSCDDYGISRALASNRDSFRRGLAAAAGTARGVSEFGLLR
jgi:hypothetical protein